MRAIWKISTLEGMRMGYMSHCSWKKQEPNLTGLINYIRCEIKKDMDTSIEYQLTYKQKIIIHDIHHKTR